VKCATNVLYVQMYSQLSSVTRQFADKPTRGLSCRSLVSSRTSQLVDLSTRRNFWFTLCSK